jgi:hypothetical protein
MSFAELCAWLCRDPYRLSLAEIGRLDDYQIASVYGYPTDDQGRPLPSYPAETPTHQELAVRRWFRAGLSRRRAQARYREWLAEQAREEAEA